MSAFSVSVVIPLYNKAPFVRRTLESVLVQTLAPTEIIIVDDGSTDGGPEVIADLIGGAIRLVRQTNAGPGPARNRGIAEATGEWVALIDGDDRWSDNHLETLADVVAAHPGVAVVASRYARLAVSADLPASETGDHVTGVFNYFEAALVYEGLFSSATAVTRRALLESGGFKAFMPGEDLELWFRLALDYPMARSTRRTSFYSQETGGIMETGARSMAACSGLNMLLKTVDRTLVDPAHTPSHDIIRALRRQLMVNDVKQELYQGNPRSAREAIRNCASVQARVPFSYRLLSLLPGRLLKASVRPTARLRNWCVR